MDYILNMRLDAKRLWIFISIACLSFTYIVFHLDGQSFSDLRSLNTFTLKKEILSPNITLFNAIKRGPQQLERKAIGILIPSTTRKIKVPLFHSLGLTTLCLPSIYKTLEDKYQYKIYVGSTGDDYLYSIRRKIETEFQNVSIYNVSGNTFVKTVNAIAMKAYEDGMDYLLRINDDTSFETKNWTSESLAVLQSYSPPNIGVVGPTCQSGNTAILTHDLVHRTHLDIFGFYYPSYFDNWWADDWITNVYKPGRSTKLESWVVKHHLKFHGTRYNVDYKKKQKLNYTVFDGQSQLRRYISSLK